MPKYQVTAPDGRKVVLTGDNPPTESDLESIFADLPKTESAKTKDPLLPNLEKTEEKIDGREDLLSNFLGRKDLVTGSGASLALDLVGGVQQRAEAAVANPLLELQKGNTKNLLNDFMQGVKGERLGQLGDPVRNTGFGGKNNELISSATGLLANIGASNAVFGGGVLKAAKEVKETFPRVLPQKMNKNFLLNKAKSAKESLDSLRKSLGAEIDEAFKPIAKEPVKNSTLVKEAIEELPENVKTSVLRDSARLLKIKFKNSKDLSINKFPLTNENVRVIRQQMDDFVPDRVWRGVGDADAETRFVLRSSSKLRKALTEGHPELKNANANFSKFMDGHYKNINRLLIDNSTGKVKDSGLRSLYRLGADRGKQIGFEQFDDLLPHSEKILKDVKSFNRRQAVTKSISTVLKVGGSAALVDRLLIRPTIEGFTKG